MSNFSENILTLAKGLNTKFPNGNEPFQIVSRLCEEAGEVAKAVNHMEKMGVKVEKYGEPDKTELAKEIRDVIGVATQLMLYYDLEDEVQRDTIARIERLRNDGFIE